MDKDLRLKQWHFYLTCALFVFTTAITWVSNDRRQTSFEATVTTKIAYMEGYEKGISTKIEAVEGTANSAYQLASTANGRINDLKHGEKQQ